MKPSTATIAPDKQAASPVVTELQVEGMTCNNCARHVTEALQSVPGVRSAGVALAAGRASVRWAAPAAPDAAQLVAAIKRAGFVARPVTATTDRASTQRTNWHLNLWLGGFVAAGLMLGEWLFGLGLARWFQWLSFALASGVQTYCGAQFYRGAWRQLRVGSSNMDTLVALGSTTAFGYSTWALFVGAGGHLYFMEATAIITLISVGHWLEARVSQRASRTLQALLELTPQTARRLERPPPPRAGEILRKGIQSFLTAEAEKEIAVVELKIGDQIALRPGDRVPVDGTVIAGDSAVDEAMLTGESFPVDKSAQAELYAGTVNLNGRLIMRVTAMGEATALAHIIAAVQRAQTSRAGIQRLGDRVSNVFVPVVVAVAIAAGLWWGIGPESARQAHAWLAQFLWSAHPPTDAASGFIIAASVLIIACPCAMGLATPAAIMAAANAAARRGILIRDGVALEKAGAVTAIVLDKTGTLTSGELAMVGPWTLDDSTLAREEAQKIAASLAQPSNHPISKVIARLSSEPVELDSWREIAGAGVQAQWRSETGRLKLIRLGALTWLRENGATVPEGGSLVESWRSQGATIVGLAVENSVVAMFGLKDSLKPNAAKVVCQLQNQGLKTFLLSGDNSLTAASIAQQVGIAPENVRAEVRPDQKAEFVKQLQARGERVAFVGDGINDAPALTQADLGIAVSRASDVAREAADIILLKSDIEAVPEALALARATLRTIKQNLFWAFFYNAVGVPLAALGFMSPVLCAAAMGVSDLIVIGNALRLNRRKFVFARPRRGG